MENATKALLIVAAVLVTVIIISLALMIVNIGNESASQGAGELNSLEVKAFNNKYEVNGGVRGGGTVKTILRYAIEDNETYIGEERANENINIRSNDTELLDTFKNSNEILRALKGETEYGVFLPENINKIMQAIRVNKKYNVWYSYSKSGYIGEIHIDTP